VLQQQAGQWDADAIFRRAMATFFDRLAGVCEGAVAIDRRGRIVYVHPSYLPTLGLSAVDEALGRDVEEVIPNSLMRRVADTGEPILLDILDIRGQHLVVTRLPIRDEAGEVIGAVGLVLDRVDRLTPLLSKFARLEHELRDARRQLFEQRRPRHTFDDYIGACPAILETKRLAMRAARQGVTVLLHGETGTGKELLAQAIHENSARADRPFVSVNVAAIPDTLVEAEFFGVAAGAYTGADRKGRDGKFKLADGGTLFLDEIAEMPLHLQAKLLRALQEQEVEPVGSNKVTKVDVRVIAATNADLARAVETGSFRSDLYYRLNVMNIALPPLRGCIADLPAICDKQLDDIAAKGGMARGRMTPSAIAELARYRWPGNVRELRNVLERAMILSDTGILTKADFAGILPAPRTETVRRPDPVRSRQQTYAEAEAEFELRTLEDALAATGGQADEAARLLELSRATFYKKLARVRQSRKRDESWK